MEPLLLAPAPRHLTPAAGELVLAGRRRIILEGAEPQALRGAGLRLQAALRRAAGVEWSLAASGLGPPEGVGARLRIDPTRAVRPQGYRLTVGPAGLLVEGHDPEGVFYGVCTLIQLIEQRGARLPALAIDDWPDFAARGVMLDVSRDRVPTMERLYELVDRLAGWKINQLQLYTEHTFAYAQHPTVWAQASPLTGDEILALDDYCRARFVELVPNQNCFGHLARWLIHPAYAHLAETHDMFETPWGHPMQGPFSLCPGDPGSLPLVRGLLDELLPHFRSPMVNVGLDETIDVGQGRSREAVAARGPGRVYLDFLQAIAAEVHARGRTMQYWGDIILQHPELIAELPGDAIALNWGYEAEHPFAEECARFAAAGLPFYVCPGTSSWCSLAGRTTNALGNLASAAEHGLRNGAAGYLITDWGDLGHWQPPAVSEPGLLAGAAYAWAWEANRGLDVAAAVSRFAYGDPGGAAGRAALALGDVYRELPTPHNSSALFWALQRPLAELASGGWGGGLRPTREQVERALAAIAAAEGELAGAQLAGAGGALLRAELSQAAALMRHACRRVSLALDPAQPGASEALAALRDELGGLIAEQRRLWLAGSRPGGLDDSLARFGPALADYAAGHGATGSAA